MPQVAIIGNSTWGNTLAALLGDNGTLVRLWTRGESEAKELNQETHSYFSTHNIKEALDKADLVIWAVPSQKLRQNVILAKSYLTKPMLLMSAAKGLEVDTEKRMSQVIAEEIPPNLREQICVLSGPNLAKEIARGLPAASVIASHDITIAEKARAVMKCANFALFTSDDIIGVELGGTLKNIVALGAGIVDGLGLGDNAKAAFTTWGWTELVSLGVALGGKTNTFYDLAGLGDLIATCATNVSRNHYLGYELAKGRLLSEIHASMSQVAEGVYTTRVAHRLAQEHGVKLPITDIIYNILFHDLPIEKAKIGFQRMIESYH
ncbi:MAG: NAD(P)H-dependent glycerol-3-phosphate dehydrogenase [Chloroflexota bacterium]|nr:NAD(P)H-dependent glycerol-3-phosphate dehydrogenase [Chloroflexota bacterium]